jgi:hypothetical protein
VSKPIVERLDGDEDMSVFEYAVTLDYKDSKLVLAVTGNEKDARLFAAAAEMLEALESVKDVLLGNVYDPQGNHKAGAIGMLQRVLAKAKGGDDRIPFGELLNPKGGAE